MPPEELVPRFETAAERLVRQATERGEFSGLPGAGRPLRLRHVGDPDWWIKQKIEDEDLHFDARAIAALRRF
ncbi:MAG: DUF1992 domain-containing protein [Bifidobacteriaceae bacterium]|jgi:hypothetical protein|nr:DUF1992 domain-containing protein [Bifidobacteriaceae bacterium]